MKWFLGFGRTLSLCLIFTLGYCLAGALAGGVIAIIGWEGDAFVTGASYGAGIVGIGLLPGIVLVIVSCIRDSSPEVPAGDVLVTLQFALMLCAVFALLGSIAGGFLGGIIGIVGWGWPGLSTGAFYGAGTGAGLAPVFLLWMLTRKD